MSENKKLSRFNKFTWAEKCMIQDGLKLYIDEMEGVLSENIINSYKKLSNEIKEDLKDGKE